MNRCIIFVASVFLAFLAISSASTASPAEWKRVTEGSMPAVAESGASSDQASWTTAPTPGLVAFVLIQL